MSSTIDLQLGADGEVLNQFIHGRDRCSFIMGPLGSGKTIAACERLLLQMCEQDANALGVRPTRWAAVRNTYPDLASTTMKDFEEVFANLGTMHNRQGGMEPPTFRAKFELPDNTLVESEVVFLALDREYSVKRLRGGQYTGFWLNEAKELLKPVVDMADLRHGRYPSMATGGVLPTWHGMFGDTNAPDDQSWYYALAEEVHPKGWKFYRQPGGLIKQGDQWVENPEAENLKHLPHEYYIRGKEGKSEDWIKVNLGNEFGYVMEGKPVHPQYVDSIHCASGIIQPEPGIDIGMGLDFGRTPAAAFFQRLPIGRYVLIDEFITNDMSAATFAPELKRYINETYRSFKFLPPWGDPAGDQGGQATDDTPFTILRAHGINAQPCHTNQPLIRRSALANPMLRNCMDGRPAFLMSPRCKTLRKGLSGGFCYKRIAVGNERYHEKPDKNFFSHVCEAAEYGLLGAGEGVNATVGKTRMSAPVKINQGFNPLARKR